MTYLYRNLVYTTTSTVGVQERVKFTSHAVQREDLQPGDHIYVYRKLGMYAHHGIYTGKNKAGEQMVIHFIDTDRGSSKLKVSAFLTETKEAETHATLDSNKLLMTHSVADRQSHFHVLFYLFVDFKIL